jgi:hypothetical protein
MSKHAHPWVQDFASYEAVLCSLNEIPSWDQAATLRAYQTYGFDDATTPGNDQSCRHDETGMMLLHDGDVVAIQFGNGSLSEALSDLFMVLSALGWKKAEVFHPVETMGALLTDMGKAIPAHMAFDVCPAKLGAETARSPEAATLVERGGVLLQGVATNQREVTEFNHLALGELESMDPPHVAASPVAVPLAAGGLSATSPVPLEKERPASAPMRSRGPVFLEDEAEPMVPVLEPGHEATAKPPVGEAASILAPEYLPPEESDGGQVSLAASHAQAHPARAASVEMAPAQDRAASPAATIESPHTVPAAPAFVAGPSDAGSEPVHAAREPAPQRSGATVFVGKSVLCFDLPDAPVEKDQVSQLAEELNASEVMHVWPGLANQYARWDFVGEVDLNAPWFAEVLANELLPGDAASAACLAADLVHLARNATKPELRDLVDRALQGQGAAKWALGEAGVDTYRKAVLGALAGLLLAQEGEAFVDIHLAPVTPERAEPSRAVFSVRTLAQAADAKVYVIHLDAADGRFVATVVKLLHAVADRYARSTRAQKQAYSLKAEREWRDAMQREASERETQHRQAAEKIHRTIAGLMEELRILGVPVVLPQL